MELNYKSRMQTGVVFLKQRPNANPFPSELLVIQFNAYLMNQLSMRLKVFKHLFTSNGVAVKSLPLITHYLIHNTEDWHFSNT